MDPISATVAVLSTTDIALRAGKELFDLISSVKRAAKGQRELQSDLEDIEVVLIRLNELVQLYETRGLDSNNAGLGVTLRKALKNIHEELERVFEYLGVRASSTSMNIRDKIKWATRQKRIKRLSQRLRDQKSNIISLLIIANSHRTLHIQDELRRPSKATVTSQQVDRARNEAPFEFIGTCWRLVFLPLRLLQVQFSETIPLLLERGGLDHGSIRCFKMEMEGLIASTTNAITTNRERPFSGAHLSTQARYQNTECESKNTEPAGLTDSVEVTRAKDQSSTTSKSSRVWHLQLTGARFTYRQITEKSSSLLTAGCIESSFTYVPEREICPSAVAGTFTRRVNDKLEVQLSRQLTAFEIVSYKSFRDYDNLIKSCTLRELTSAIANGSLPLYMLDYNRRFIIHYSAARAGRLDILEYLASRGLGPATIDGGSHALRGLSEFWRGQFYTFNLIKPRDDIFYWLIERGCDLENKTSSREPPVHYTVSLETNSLGPTLTSIAYRWIVLLVGQQYDLETQDHNGRTYLLAQACLNGGYSAITMSYLLHFGASPYAVDEFDRNAVICSLWSRSNWDEGFRDVIIRKLLMCIHSGCDVSHCDDKGITPSEHALLNSCWYEFCLSLEITNKPILAVLEEDCLRKLKFLKEHGWVQTWHTVNSRKTKYGVVAVKRYMQELVSLVLHYATWRRGMLVAFSHLKITLLQLCSSENEIHRLLLDFLMARSRPGIEYHGGDADYKPVYEALKDIMANHSVLKNLILAFDRTIKPKHLPVYTTWDRETDIVDIAIIVINTMRRLYFNFMPSKHSFPGVCGSEQELAARNHWYGRRIDDHPPDQNKWAESRV